MPLLQPPGPDRRPSETTYVDGYNSIVSRVRKKGAGRSGGVVIFVGLDVDGLLASRILAFLFGQDDVPYRIIPIRGYSELEVKRDEVLASEEIHTIILLSLGSMLHLDVYFALPSGCHLHIIDAHRPWHLDNLFGIDIDIDEDGNGTGEGKIWVWGDGSESDMATLKKSWEAIEYEPSDDEGESDEEYDEENEDDEDDENDESDGADDGDEEAAGRKRRRGDSAKPKKRRREDDDMPRRLPQAVREAHEERIQRHYSAGTSYGMSVAQTVYLLATVLERADNDLLWLAILALTDQYVTAKIDRDDYESYVAMLKDEVARLNPLETTGPNPDNRNITSSDEELRFVLFRHWNLYDSMLHSPYVASRLGVWKEKGRRGLQRLLAKMGFSLQQCQQEYTHMDIELKRDLPARLEESGPEIGLVDLVYPSFIRAYGFQLSSLSAADAVEGIQALLDAAKGIKLEVEIVGGRGGGEWFGGTRTWTVGDKSCLLPDGSNGEENGESAPEEVWHVQNFWIAYDACDDIALLRKSLQLSKSLHRAILRQGSAILDKAIIRRLRSFRFAAVREGPDLKLFCHPSPLSRLALWLMDATRDAQVKRNDREGKANASLPFVVACLNEDRNTYVVVGVTGAPELGDVRKNKLGLAFQKAADLSHAKSLQDMFETAIVEVDAEDLQGFIEALHMYS